MSEHDIDFRKLRYFLAVAAESNFSRAATRLHMTQPALSRQIQSLETEVGARLFERDRQGTRLTPAGDQFRKDAEQLLELSVAAQRRARKAARPPCLFSVGFMPGVPLTPIIRESVLTGRPYNNRFASIVTVKERKVTLSPPGLP